MKRQKQRQRRAAKHNHEDYIIEIRAAEGGDDAKKLVEDQLSIYCRYASRRCL